MSTNFFSSLSGSFDYVSSMSSILGDYAQIKNGSYGSLMKSYVNKVGNKAALNAYRETGSTTTAADSAVSTTTKKASSSKESFLDSHLSNIGKSAASSSKSESASSTTTNSAKYEKIKSSWLDDQLKQYDKDASKTTAADTSISYDTTI